MIDTEYLVLILVSDIWVHRHTILPYTTQTSQHDVVFFIYLREKSDVSVSVYDQGAIY